MSELLTQSILLDESTPLDHSVPLSQEMLLHLSTSTYCTLLRPSLVLLEFPKLTKPVLLKRNVSLRQQAPHKESIAFKAQAKGKPLQLLSLSESFTLTSLVHQAADLDLMQSALPNDQNNSTSPTSSKTYTLPQIELLNQAQRRRLSMNKLPRSSQTSKCSARDSKPVPGI